MLVRRLHRHRSAAVLGAVALALGAAGCGGSGSDATTTTDPGAAYARAWNGACRGLTDAQSRAQQAAAKPAAKASRADAEAQFKAIAAPLGRFLTSVTGVLGTVRGLDAPPEFRGFQKGVDRAVPRTIAVLRDARGPIARGDIAATQRLAKRLGPGGSVLPTLPDALKQRATACNAY
jgi:hypothetical protein